MTEILGPAFEKNNIAIAFAANDAFVPYMAAMICSIIANGNADNNYDFVVLQSDIAPNSQQKLYEMVKPHLLCKYVVSSQADAITTNPFPGYSDNYRDITADLRFIFLQHGVTKDDISDWLNRFDKNIYGFITSGYPEWKSIIDGDYFYEEKAIWLTGFPRFDELYHNEKNIITIMPTWRMYLMQWSGEQGGVWRANENFESSTFCQFYRELLNSTRLIESASKNGFLIHFFPHPNLRSSVEKFHVNNGVKILGPEAIYRDIYAQSNLVVTDYSSACFDFAYSNGILGRSFYL